MYGQKRIKVSQFFNKDQDFQQLIRGYYGLNYIEFIILSALQQSGEADTAELIELTNEGWPRNKINSALKSLMKQDLCTRERISPPDLKRGYKYIYTPKSSQEIKQEMMVAFEEWIISAKELLEDLSYHFNSVDTEAYQRKKSKREKIRKDWFGDEE